MLLEVDIRDFAIVRAARVELGGGLCVLSGETGAGKSIIIDAIGALLGARAGAEQIRAGANSARLRAVFDLSEVPVATRCLADLGAEVDPEGLCVITREITTSGRGRCTINGSTATLGMLRQLGEVLIDIHGQHEHQSLLRVSQHQAILDATGGAAVATALADYRAAHAAWRETTEAIARLRLDEGEKARRADTLRFQVDEITKAELRLGEEEELNAERSRLAHAEKLLASAARAYAALAESDDVSAAADRVAEALHALHEMCHFDPQLGPLATDLEAALATVTEAARTLSGYVDELEADPQRLDHLEQRLDLIDRLKRRYGGSVAEIIAFGERAAGELEQIEGADEELARLEQRCGELAEALLACGG
ncbi:MAG: AAA family ATPase, partial [Armatimonadetes bacterium]|nr:AAA family ATPase [Armatimonadota bacterium]